MDDLSFVREVVRPLYAGSGRRSIDPVVFLKLQLVFFFEDLRCERRRPSSAPSSLLHEAGCGGVAVGG
jgi:hypothetical protein